jgi:hypothetical protein
MVEEARSSQTSVNFYHATTTSKTVIFIYAAAKLYILRNVVFFFYVFQVAALQQLSPTFLIFA